MDIGHDHFLIQVPHVPYQTHISYHDFLLMSYILKAQQVQGYMLEFDFQAYAITR